MAESSFWVLLDKRLDKVDCQVQNLVFLCHVFDKWEIMFKKKILSWFWTLPILKYSRKAFRIRFKLCSSSTIKIVLDKPEVLKKVSLGFSSPFLVGLEIQFPQTKRFKRPLVSDKAAFPNILNHLSMDFSFVHNAQGTVLGLPIQLWILLRKLSCWLCKS